MDVATRPAKVTVATACRSCAGNLVDVLDLGAQPLANAFCETPDHDCYRYPLVLTVCQGCTLLQLRHEVDRADVFTGYAYRTGASAPMTAHFKALADELRPTLSRNDLVVDIGSNDGTFLSFLAHDIRVMGVDPGLDTAAVPTMRDFFDHELAWRIEQAWGKAKYITACNVLAHTSQPRELLEAARDLLTDDGQIILEYPSARTIFQGGFDTIYHEHLYYFTFSALESLLPEGLRICKVQPVPTHGGSWRVYLDKSEGEHVNVLQKNHEAFAGYCSEMGWQKLSAERDRRCDKIRQQLEEHDQVAGYGAPAKATVLLNYLGVGPEKMPYVVDSTPEKQGRYVPGVHIPVRKEEELGQEPVLILAWNYRADIEASHPQVKFLSA